MGRHRGERAPGAYTLATLITAAVAVTAGIATLVASCSGPGLAGGPGGRALSLRSDSTDGAAASASISVVSTPLTSMNSFAAAPRPAPIESASAVAGVAAAPPLTRTSAAKPVSAASSTVSTVLVPANTSPAAAIVAGAACSRSGMIARTTAGRYAICWTGPNKTLIWYLL